MPCVHEFGIIPEFDPDSEEYEEYEPERYGCIAVEDDLLLGVFDRLRDLDTYWHRGDRPAKGFAYCGITLLPAASLPAFLAELQREGDPELLPLGEKIREAVRQGKYMIHYGL